MTYYLVSNIVRTHYQAVFISVREKEIEDYLLLSFKEPREYIPTAKWLIKLLQSKLSGQEVIQSPDAISGATLTHQATKRAIKMAFFMNEQVK